MQVPCPHAFMMLLLALAPPGEAYKPPKDAQSGEADTLLMLDRQFDDATSRLGADGWVAYFAENGSMVSSRRMPTTGREAIRKVMSQALGDSAYSLRWTPAKANIFIPGWLGYTVGRYEERSTDGEGRTHLVHGSYTTIWMRQADGSWKIIFDTGRADASGAN